MRVGLLVNPIAGIGGPGAHKGSDTHWQEALAEGTQPQAQARAARVVAAAPELEWITLPGAMGVPGLPTVPLEIPPLGHTTEQDTRRGAQALIAAGIDLLCFAGGDGTATVLAHTLGDQVPCLGIPAGVKITSAVFAHAPEEAAWLLNNWAPDMPTVARDVTDLDEEAYRQGRVETRLTGSLRVPLSPAVQGGKVATTMETPLDGLVDMALDQWDANALHLVGAGSVCRAIKQQFWGEPTLLGIDAIQGQRIIERDLDAERINALLASTESPVYLWLTLIGGQGMLIGRGTQPLQPAALRRIGWPNLRIVAPPEKLVGLHGVHIDTGDPELDASAPAYMQVISGWNETRMVRVLHTGQAQ